MTELFEEQGVVLEDELLDHLATPESALILYREKFQMAFVQDTEVAKVLDYVFSYIKEHREAPTRDILATESGFTFQDPATPIDWLIDKFRDQYKRNEGKALIQKVARLVLSDPDEAVRIATEEFGRIRATTIPRRNMLDTTQAMEVVGRYNKAVEDGLGDGVTFGWEQVDRDLVGLRKNTLSVIVARPKVGKSWFLLASAHEAWERGANVDIYTLELSIEEMQDRHACMHARIPYFDFMRKSLNAQDFKEFKAAQEFVANRENKIRFLRPPTGERTVENFRRLSAEVNPAAVYIDQISWIDAERRMPEQRWREVEFIIDDLKRLSDDFPVYVAAQFNREAANLAEMADLSKIGLSDRIGQTADMILGLYASKDMKKNGLVEFGVVDSRAFIPQSYEMKMNLGRSINDPYIKYLGRKED